jgi:adenine-specific DNA-methyltransferase
VSIQEQLFVGLKTLERAPQAPTTRYQGSKLKLLDWIWKSVRDFKFSTVLDAFGGTGSVSYLFKTHGKVVTYNDYLKFNKLIGTALIENSTINLTNEDLDFILVRHSDLNYDNFIRRTFSDTYFTDDENDWLDTVVQNIGQLQNEYKKALAFYALFQSCIIKRPYNLFHRKNLYIRTADVNRGFGNKVTWDTPFEIHFRKFVNEINSAVFDSGEECYAVCHDAIDVPGEYDLVYVDTPYINKHGIGLDYLDFYHFLEGLSDYANWSFNIDFRRKHLPLKGTPSPWCDPAEISTAFKRLFQRYANSVLVVSYRSDGIPSPEYLLELLSSVKNNVRKVHFGQYKYVLSTNTTSKEILLIGY